MSFQTAPGAKQAGVKLWCQIRLAQVVGDGLLEFDRLGIRFGDLGIIIEGHVRHGRFHRSTGQGGVALQPLQGGLAERMDDVP